jgi:hypothetical protein
VAFLLLVAVMLIILLVTVTIGITGSAQLKKAEKYRKVYLFDAHD